MVLTAQGSLSPSPSSGPWGWKHVEVGILTVLEVGQDSPAAEELSSSCAPAGAGGPGDLTPGARWTKRSTTLLL